MVKRGVGSSKGRARRHSVPQVSQKQRAAGSRSARSNGGSSSLSESPSNESDSRDGSSLYSDPDGQGIGTQDRQVSESLLVATQALALPNTSGFEHNMSVTNGALQLNGDTSAIEVDGASLMFSGAASIPANREMLSDMFPDAPMMEDVSMSLPDVNGALMVGNAFSSISDANGASLVENVHTGSADVNNGLTMENAHASLSGGNGAFTTGNAHFSFSYVNGAALTTQVNGISSASVDGLSGMAVDHLASVSVNNPSAMELDETFDLNRITVSIGHALSDPIPGDELVALVNQAKEHGVLREQYDSAAVRRINGLFFVPQKCDE